MSNSIKFSPQQEKVHGLILLGKTTGEIARGLGLGIATAKTHVSKVFRKAGVKSKNELLALRLAQAGKKAA